MDPRAEEGSEGRVGDVANAEVSECGEEDGPTPCGEGRLGIGVDGGGDGEDAGGDVEGEGGVDGVAVDGEFGGGGGEGEGLEEESPCANRVNGGILHDSSDEIMEEEDKERKQEERAMAAKGGQKKKKKKLGFGV